MAKTQLCLIASLLIIATVAPVSGMNQACISLTGCKGASAQSIKEGDAKDLCEPTLKQIQCIVKHLDLCDEKPVTEAFRDTVKKFNDSYQEKCVMGEEGKTGASLDDAGMCSDLTSCMPKDVGTKLSNGVSEKMCSELTEIVKCYDKHMGSCKVDLVKKSVANILKTLKTRLNSKCNGTGKPSASLAVLLVSAFTVLASVRLLFSR